MSDLFKILRTAVEYGASDVFLSTGSKPALKINGQLLLIEELELITEETFRSYLELLASKEDIITFETTKDVDFSREVEEIGRFRINAFMQSKGPSMSLRPIPNNVKTIDELSLPAQLKNITNLESGLVLVTGPTGSGKTTTLAAMVEEINAQKTKHIITIEDPIEFAFQNKRSLIEQREIKTHTESFEKALRAALREAPDVILVGELRDLETIALAVTAAETGHLVFGTLHTSGAAQTVDRIIDVFPVNQQTQIKTQLAMSLQAVIWQKLVSTVDGKGRVPACEILIKNSAVANLIRKGATHQIYSTMETSINEGMQTMTYALDKLAAEGRISNEYVASQKREMFEDTNQNQ